MKTFSAKAEDVNRNWWIVDAENEILGRLATKVATRATSSS
jgi:large subunit ribosomal protein L13